MCVCVCLCVCVKSEISLLNLVYEDKLNVSV